MNFASESGYGFTAAANSSGPSVLRTSRLRSVEALVQRGLGLDAERASASPQAALVQRETSLLRELGELGHVPGEPVASTQATASSDGGTARTKASRPPRRRTRKRPGCVCSTANTPGRRRTCSAKAAGRARARWLSGHSADGFYHTLNVIVLVPNPPRSSNTFKVAVCGPGA